MQYFAELGLDNIILRVIAVNDENCKDENDNISEEVGAAWCRSELGGNWKLTDYNGVYRKNFAGIGMHYNTQLDAFIPIKEHDDWVFDEASGKWKPSTPMPDDGKSYEWNSIEKKWTTKE